MVRGPPGGGAAFWRGHRRPDAGRSPLIAAAYPFPDGAVICDVAGGTGALLAEILRTHCRSQGILVETANVLAEAAPYLQAAGLNDRVQLAEGDIFRAVPGTADIYLLKWVLHDWDDATCQTILRSVRAAMPTGAKLVVIEGVQDHNSVHPRFSMIDLQMLVVTEGGRERSIAQLEHLITAVGLPPGRTRRTATGPALLEATKP